MQSARPSSEHSSSDLSMLLVLKEMQDMRTEASTSRQDAAKQAQEMRVEKHAQPLTESSGSWGCSTECAHRVGVAGDCQHAGPSACPGHV